MGCPLDVARMLCAQPAPRHRPAPGVVDAQCDRYKRGALRRAAHAVATAIDGTRNQTLNREAFSLARLAIDETTIAEVLRDAAPAAGLSTAEARRTITSALLTRRETPGRRSAS